MAIGNAHSERKRRAILDEIATKLRAAIGDAQTSGADALVCASVLVTVLCRLERIAPRKTCGTPRLSPASNQQG